MELFTLAQSGRMFAKLHRAQQLASALGVHNAADDSAVVCI
jgi:hypothetical protein